MEKVNAQGTLEYLVIIGVVVVVALVLVGLLSGFFGSASGVSLTSNKAFWLTQSLGLSEAGVDSEGDTFFVLSNNSGENITLVGYSVNGDVKNFTYEQPVLFPGDKKVIFLARQTACPSGVCSFDDVVFLYISSNGVQKSSGGNDLLVEQHTDVSYAMFSGSQSNLVCVNSGDVGVCGSGSGGSDGSPDGNIYSLGILNQDNNSLNIGLNYNPSIATDFNISNSGLNKNINFDINDGGVTRTAIQINGTEGSVTMPRQSYVHAYASAAQTIPTGTVTTVTLDTEVADVLGEFSSNKFTAKNAGVYSITGQIMWLNTNAAKRYLLYLDYDDGSEKFKMNAYYSASVAILATNTISMNLYLPAGGWAQLQSYQDLGGNESTYGTNSERNQWITIVKVA